MIAINKILLYEWILKQQPKDTKRKQCRRRAAIESIISHLKADHRMARNYLKGAIGDHINLLMAAAAWNLKQWLLAILALFPVAKDAGRLKILGWKFKSSRATFL